MITQKDIEELLIGHYVLDIVKQQESFTLNHAGHIKSQAIIDHLKIKGVQTLLIDTDKTLKPSSVPAPKNKHSTPTNQRANKAQSDKAESSKTKQSTVVIQTPAHNVNQPSASVSTPASQEKKSTLETEQEEQVNVTALPLPKMPSVAEITEAKALFTHSKKVQQQLLNCALNGEPLDLERVKEITDQTIEIIFKNADALACVINIRNKDEYLLEHSVSVAIFMAAFARYLQIDKETIQQLAIGAFLHDIGKIKIPDKILNKPSKLTDDEFTIIKTHTNHTIDILSKTPNISEISLEVAALHHEKLNGQGYPHQVKGEDISQYGRMITICDIFDALTADRVYKKGYPHVKAFNILLKLAENNELDMSLVNQFIKCMGVYPVGTLVELTSNKLAIVEGRNNNNPVKPFVRAFYSVEHRHYVMAEDLDLSKSKDAIVKSVRANDYNLNMNKIVEFLLLQG